MSAASGSEVRRAARDLGLLTGAREAGSFSQTMLTWDALLAAAVEAYWRNRVNPCVEPSHTGYNLHLLRGEKPCEGCRDAHRYARWENRVKARLYGPAPRSAPMPCGTHAAHVRHKYRGEEPCEPCKVAEREYQRQAKRRQRAGAGAA